MKLVSGNGTPETGGCLMNVAAWLAGEKWSDHPECVDPMIACIGRCANDRLPSDEERERVLGPFVFRVMGTRTDDPEVTRLRQRECVRFAIEQARSVLHCVPEGEDRPRLAIEAAERWLRDPTKAKAAAARAAVRPAVRAAVRPAVRAAGVRAADAAAAAARAAAAADAAAAYAADAAAAARAASLVDLLDRLCSIGERREITHKRRLEDMPAYAR